MTKKQLEFVRDLLQRIKPQDEQVQKALAYVNVDIKQYEARRGQLREQYEDPRWSGF
jgi:hypothetical protein